MSAWLPRLLADQRLDLGPAEAAALAQGRRHPLDHIPMLAHYLLSLAPGVAERAADHVEVAQRVAKVDPPGGLPQPRALLWRVAAEALLGARTAQCDEGSNALPARAGAPCPSAL